MSQNDQSQSTNPNVDLIVKLAGLQATNQQLPTLHELAELVDSTQDYSMVKEWAAKIKIGTRRDFEKAISRQKIIDELGELPTCASDFVEIYVKKYGIEVDCKGEVRYNQEIIFQDTNIRHLLLETKETLENARNDGKTLPDRIEKLEDEVRMYEAMIGTMTQDVTVQDVVRDMRLEIDKHHLRISPKAIDDAVDKWIADEFPKQKMLKFMNLRYDRKREGRGDRELLKMVNACFDLSEHSAEYVAGGIKKYMWQVKRKMMGLPVTNHLMPILLGPQGVGKSTFMDKLTAPLEQVRVYSDFNQITDDRNVDLFLKNYVVIVDEMGYAARSDIDAVKNLISTPHISRRPMGTNRTITVKQNATFIGASNKEVGQLIRDETGIRRFLPLRFKNLPDWKTLNEIDMVLIWNCVNEVGDDPMLPFADLMKEEQEKYRTIRPCEEWTRTLKDGDFAGNDFEDESAWYARFKEWQERHYTKFRMDLNEWRMELIRLKNHDLTDSFPFLVKEDGRRLLYKFIGDSWTLFEKEKTEIKKDEVTEATITKANSSGEIKKVSDDEVRARIMMMRERAKARKAVETT